MRYFWYHPSPRLFFSRIRRRCLSSFVPFACLISHDSAVCAQLANGARVLTKGRRMPTKRRSFLKLQFVSIAIVDSQFL